MVVRARFKLDDEPTDTPAITAQLAALRRDARAFDLQFGADVTLWYCERCDYAVADFAYGDTDQL